MATPDGRRHSIGRPYGSIDTTDWTPGPLAGNPGYPHVPAMNTADIENIARAIAADHGNRADGLIEILHRLQELVRCRRRRASPSS